MKSDVYLQWEKEQHQHKRAGWRAAQRHVLWLSQSVLCKGQTRTRNTKQSTEETLWFHSKHVDVKNWSATAHSSLNQKTRSVKDAVWLSQFAACGLPGALPPCEKGGVRHFSYHYIDHLLGKTRKSSYGPCYSNITWPLLQEHDDNNLMNLFSQLLPRWEHG